MRHGAGAGAGAAPRLGSVSTAGDDPAAAPVIGVLALQGDVREHLRALEGAGAVALPVRRPEELEGLDGVVVPGGESTTMAKLARAFDLIEPLRELLRGGLPAYGSCAGMILLADRVLDGVAGQETLGGLDVLVRRNAFGRQVDSFESPVRFARLASDGPDSVDGVDSADGADGGGADGGGRLVHAVFIRAPWVEEVGPGVQVLARVRGGEADGRIVAVRQGHLIATSFHPELTGDTRVHRYFVDLVRAARRERTTSVAGEEEREG